MAKISKHGGPTNKDGPIQHVLSRRPQLGVVKSVGGNSTQSTESVSKKSKDENPSPQQPVQTTEPPSNQLEEESSIAHLTDGSTRETPKTRSVKKAAKKANPRTRNPEPENEYDDFD